MALSFNLVSDVQSVNRRSFSFTDPTVLKPSGANPLLLGEFLELQAGYKVGRASGDGDAPAFAAFVELGRTDVQAVGKASVLFMHSYEADTEIFNATENGGITAVGQKLIVGDVTIGGKTKRGLVGLLASPTGDEFIVGYVTRLPADNGGLLRFLRA